MVCYQAGCIPGAAQGLALGHVVFAMSPHLWVTGWNHHSQEKTQPILAVPQHLTQPEKGATARSMGISQ